MDLRIVKSSGPLLSRVRRFQLEVVSDDCTPLYKSQPHCSQVVDVMRDLGFVPVRPTRCTPIFPRHKANHFCEMEILFVQASRAPEQVALDDPLLFYHNIHLNGCDGVFAARHSREVERAPPAGKAVAKLGNFKVRGYGNFFGPGYLSTCLLYTSDAADDM
eukprot:1951769-Prymnesium_polylepis.1